MTHDQYLDAREAAYRIGRYFCRQDINENPYKHFGFITGFVVKARIKELSMWFEDGWHDQHKEKGFIA